jgi:hypothetical protein
MADLLLQLHPDLRVDHGHENQCSELPLALWETLLLFVNTTILFILSSLFFLSLNVEFNSTFILDNFSSKAILFTMD